MTVASGLCAVDFTRPPGMEPGPLQVTLGGWAKLGGGGCPATVPATDRVCQRH